MKAYRGILLDLFWTVIDVDITAFPEITIEIDGQVQKTRSHAKKLYQVVRNSHPEFDEETFLKAFFARRAQVQRQWSAGVLEEVSSIDKFGQLLVHLNLYADEKDEACRQLAQDLTQTHMKTIIVATHLPAGRLDILRALSERYELALVSNFDHAPAAHEILRCHGLDSFFKKIVISDDLGKRKPHPDLFETALKALGINPEQSLMVGDTPLADIHGASQLGCDTAWLARGKSLWPETLDEPTYQLEDLNGLVGLLQLEL